MEVSPPSIMCRECAGRPHSPIASFRYSEVTRRHNLTDDPLLGRGKKKAAKEAHAHGRGLPHPRDGDRARHRLHPRHGAGRHRLATLPAGHVARVDPHPEEGRTSDAAARAATQLRALTGAHDGDGPEGLRLLRDLAAQIGDEGPVPKDFVKRCKRVMSRSREGASRCPRATGGGKGAVHVTSAKSWREDSPSRARALTTIRPRPSARSRATPSRAARRMPSPPPSPRASSSSSSSSSTTASSRSRAGVPRRPPLPPPRRYPP